MHKMKNPAVVGAGQYDGNGAVLSGVMPRQRNAPAVGDRRQATAPVQKNAEWAVRDSEKRFRRMVEVAAEGIWLMDTTGRTSFVNNRMTDILGYAKEEMLGRSYLDFFDPEERGRARLDFLEFEIRKVLTPEPREYHLRRKDGSIVWLDITGTLMTDDSGIFTGVLKMCADVTERKSNEQRLRQTQKLESLRILAGGLAHDFNNLLTAIMGNASLALETTEPGSLSRGCCRPFSPPANGLRN